MTISLSCSWYIRLPPRSLCNLEEGRRGKAHSQPFHSRLSSALKSRMSRSFPFFASFLFIFIRWNRNSMQNGQAQFLFHSPRRHKNLFEQERTGKLEIDVEISPRDDFAAKLLPLLELLKYYVWFISHKVNNVRGLTVHKFDAEGRLGRAQLLLLWCDLRNQSLSGPSRVPSRCLLRPKRDQNVVMDLGRWKVHHVVHHPWSILFGHFLCAWENRPSVPDDQQPKRCFFCASL